MSDTPDQIEAVSERGTFRVSKSCETHSGWRLVNVSTAPDGMDSAEVWKCPRCLQEELERRDERIRELEQERDAAIDKRLMKMFVWKDASSFTAMAQAHSVAEARILLLDHDDLGESGDGSCPERDAARDHIKNTTPFIYYGAAAEFALKDSASVRESDAECDKLKISQSALEQANKELLESRNQDTERLDWLSESGTDGRLPGRDFSGATTIRDAHRYLLGEGKTLREAIDAARAALSKHGGTK